MQRIKKEIRQSLLITAKAEFLENGFEKASIRSIAAKVNTSKSNLYNYFKNKDDLFCQILEPTMDTIKKALAKQKNIQQDIKTYTPEGQKQIISVIMSFVYQNKDDFLLLLHRSDGSSLGGFRNMIKNEYTSIMLSWLKQINPQNNISTFFVESVADFYINTIAQLILSDKTPEEVQMHFKEFLPFVYGGWNALINAK